jgi:hypothetical protein
MSKITTGPDLDNPKMHKCFMCGKNTHMEYKAQRECEYLALSFHALRADQDYRRFIHICWDCWQEMASKDLIEAFKLKTTDGIIYKWPENRPLQGTPSVMYGAIELCDKPCGDVYVGCRKAKGHKGPCKSKLNFWDKMQRRWQFRFWE